MNILQLLSKQPNLRKSNEYVVDFISKQNKRFQWDVQKKIFTENSKTNKENFDLLHNGMEY